MYDVCASLTVVIYTRPALSSHACVCMCMCMCVCVYVCMCVYVMPLRANVLRVRQRNKRDPRGVADRNPSSDLTDIPCSRTELHL